MAQKYLVQIVDDLDGTQLDQSDAEQVSFAFDGVSYVIDLSTSNAENLRATLRRYTDAARRAGHRRPSHDRQHSERLRHQADRPRPGPRLGQRQRPPRLHPRPHLRRHPRRLRRRSLAADAAIGHED